MKEKITTGMKLVLTVLLLAVFSFMSAAEAKAAPAAASSAKFIIQNALGNDVNVSVAYYDITKREYTTRGWYNVKAGQSRTLRIENVSPKSGAYFHAESKGAVYSDKRGDGKTYNRWISDSSFTFIGDAKPKKGKNLRSGVFFRCKDLSGNTFRYRVDKVHSTPKPAAKPASGSNAAAIGGRIVEFTNAARNEKGRPALKIDDALMKAAQKRAVECASKYGHTRPDGRSCFTVFGEFGVAYRKAAENILYDNYPEISASKAVDVWMNSEGHRENILTKEFTHIGVGVYSKGGKNYCVQMFIQK